MQSIPRSRRQILGPIGIELEGVEAAFQVAVMRPITDVTSVSVVGRCANNTVFLHHCTVSKVESRHYFNSAVSHDSLAHKTCTVESKVTTRHHGPNDPMVTEFGK
jgi:hypothetical protein